MNDNSATAQLIHRAILQFGRHQPTIREQFAISAVNGILASGAKDAAGNPLTIPQIRNRAIAIADAMVDGRTRADTTDA